MTAPLRGTPRLSTAAPPSQNTAPVAEFRCLFTTDLRRKQKRWQDGYVKFHTFNNRVMAYDTSRNFLGDTYWKENNALQEGDELTLDKGVMIQVEDPVGVTETDLTPLLTKKSPAKPSNLAPLPRPSAAPLRTLQSASQLRHRSLNSLLGTSRGPMGKAVPIVSPYEAKHGKENGNIADHPAKRVKTSHGSPVRPARVPTIPVARSTMDRTGATVARNVAPRPAALQRSPMIIDITSDSPDQLHSDDSVLTLPNEESPMKRAERTRPAPKPPIIPITMEAEIVIAEPSRRITKLPKGKVPLPNSKTKSRPEPAPAPRYSSPPVSTTNHMTGKDPDLEPPKDPTPVEEPSQSPTRGRKPKALKLATSAKRGMLMCQAVRPPLSRTPPELSAKAGAVLENGGTISGHQSKPTTTPQNSRDQAGFRKRDSSPRAHAIDPAKMQDDATTTRGRRDRRPKSPGIPGPASKLPPFPSDDMDVVTGLMDQQIYPPKAPYSRRAQKQNSSSPSTTMHTNRRLPETANETTSANTTKSAPRQRKSRSPQTKDLPDSAKASSKELDTSDRPQTTRRATSSNEGPRKKAKRSQPIQDDVPKESPARALRPPPNPPRATSKAGLLSKQPNFPSIEDDPIEDDISSQKPISPKRSFRRVRSENDAPIPSTSEDWEARNIDPQAPHADTDTTTSNPRSAATTPAANAPRGLAALVKKTDPRRKFARAQSLVVDTNAPAAGAPNAADDIPSPPVDDDIGPWSTEAFDLFDWRPPALGEKRNAGIGIARLVG